jgi:tripartite-type tricarboxylate transporter receptor subunit TctC
MERTRRTLLAAGLAAIRPGSRASAQPAWPAKPIRLIVPYPPGGQTDIVSRWLGEPLAPVLGQPFVIDNRAGAQGIVGLQALKQAAPDGHTIAYGNTSNLIINQFAYRRLPYDPMADFEAVSQLGLAPLGLAVPTASGIRSVDQFVQWVRANPGKPTSRRSAPAARRTCMARCSSCTPGSTWSTCPTRARARRCRASPPGSRRWASRTSRRRRRTSRRAA